MTELSAWRQITLSELPSGQWKFQKVLDMEKEAEEEQGRHTHTIQQPGSEDAGEGHKPGMLVTPGSWKTQGKKFPMSCGKKYSFADTFILVQRDC